MTIRKHNPWEEDAPVSALVSLPARDLSLFARASGPARRPGDPVAILFTGAGGALAAYVKVEQHLCTFVRTLFYDRAGYDLSTLPSNVESLTAQDGAIDLDALLSKIDVGPPYLLIGHSFGGIPLREFLHHQLVKHRPAKTTDIISGVVLYDTVSELAWALFPRMPSADLLAVSQDVDWEELTNFKTESGMTDEEWNAAIEASLRTIKGARREDTHGSARALAKKQQLEKHTYHGGILAVIRCNMAGDYQKMYDEGVRLGGGTQKEREGAKQFIEEWKMYSYQMVKAQVDLVGSSDQGSILFRELMDWGHDSLMRKPELVGDAVRWVLAALEEKGMATVDAVARGSRS
ncbi:uncharacterized protein Z520_10281 [Fonsecaea multimorphosa CBS 102226]|uniref:AB hydrolase-1 domain-containing protein n=1 Tax=Fonsecaea multimorphosa CBS 102226 TaxID=1442371 RepID=A0A0D2JU16_9EURO|nr:uncharacterized protein Z520_10281 [Fonsecaea multimorphosa CBS 102226]KIX93944.1 hypothetical protein Z520_10281 [Fonsecaea multimorphosa CBS 102226]OAL19292.1 hypothetical protein AYO22_09836 [Fonsecaea multimorphosa]